MMKKIAMLVFLSVVGLTVMAQDKDDLKNIKLNNNNKKDLMVFDIFSDIWMNQPGDSMDVKAINRGFNFNLMKEFKMGKSNFSFAVGLGISAHNLYSNAIPVKSFEYDTNGTKVYDGKTVFTHIPSFSADGKQEINYKNNKLTVVYADIPLEFRFRTKNSAFKFYLGGKIGLMLSNHNKYHGDDYSGVYPTGTVRVKDYKIPNINTVRYGLTARIGWKWVQAYGYYSLSHLFKKDKGPDMYPISIGVTFTPY